MLNDDEVAYTENGVEFIPEWKSHNVTRTHVAHVIHSCMTVDDTREWDQVMHPQVNCLDVGQTTILESCAGECLKVTKVGNNLFDIEYGYC